MLFWATGGPSWRQPWPVADPSSDPCIDGWYGVHCNFRGQIKTLRLASHGLVGYLPAAFTRLSTLEELWRSCDEKMELRDVSSNALSQSLPNTIGQLRALRVLRLNNNAFTGPVPTELSQLPRLEVLAIELNQFQAPLPNAVYSMQAKGLAMVTFDVSLTPTVFDSQ
ncbi:hypothetical protein ACHHYP_04019 [Achlya hypogyna]|uniref:Leucine-rich repeat-containing N-terminal plant-type domain-containing protein n=1 Tax=Achlya hypogyna TaxID=1202772 RepID=A0A1V9Z2C4_ACHHY|nr:hypothetical protein ACHHYP_04019 [Achlya hypogyna]